jgi:hypothetical protein
MPIQAEPDGTLDVENATLRSRNIVSLTNMVAGNDVVRSSAAPTLEVYGDPSHGGTEPTLELVSNTSNTVSTTFTRLTSNAGVFTIQSGTDGTTDSKGDIAFSSIGGTTERMRIQGSTGNVGIGTTSPMNTGLHIAKQYTASGGNTDHFDPQLFITGNSGTGGTQLSAIGFSGASDADAHQRMVGGSIYYKGGGGNFGMDGYLGLAVTNSSAGSGDPYGLTEGELVSHTRLAITNNGNVGIGTITPYAKLHVIGNGGRFSTSPETDPNTHHGVAHYINYATNTVWYGNGNFEAISIYGSDDILSSSYIGSISGYITASDSRIKKEIVDVEDDSALETLRLLKPKQYKYVDEVKRGSEPVWGFIAQQVRDTLPYATQTRTECLPNIYELANVSASNVITLTNFDTSTLESNAMVLKVYDMNDTEHLVNIAEVIDGHSIRVNEDLSEWTEGDKIFVYGQQVDDFVFLKKDAIWTVATSALQEVDRQLQAEKTKVTTLETQLASVLTRLDALEGA